jgi:AcrR family transcriptional regulator
MGRPSKSSGIALTREKILEVALQFVERDSLDRLTTQALGKALGVTQPAFFHHYRNRATLIADIVNQVCHDMANQMERTSGDWDKRVERLVEVYSRTFLRYHGVADHLMNLGPYTSGSRRIVDIWVRMFADAGAGPKRASLYSFHIGMHVLGFFSWYDRNVDIGPSKTADSPLSKLDKSDYADTPYALVFDEAVRETAIQQRLMDGLHLIVPGIRDDIAGMTRAVRGSRARRGVRQNGRLRSHT